MADRLIPPPAGDDAMGWPADAITIGRLVDEALSEASPALRRRLAQLLSALERPLPMLLLTGSPTPLFRRTAEEAEGVLRALSVSALPMKRQAFQSLKRLIGFVYFSHSEQGANPTWSALRYAPGAVPADGESQGPGPLHIVTPRPGQDLQAEVCVIGSGAGGGGRLGRGGARRPHPRDGQFSPARWLPTLALIAIWSQLVQVGLNRSDPA